MKQLLCLLALLSFAWLGNTPARAQAYFNCVTQKRAVTSLDTQPISDKAKQSQYSANATNAVSASCVPPYAVRINVHFILTADGKGNFTETGDGGSDNAADWNTAGQWDTPANPGGALPRLNANPNYNGYQFAQDIITAANVQWRTNPQMQLPANNNTPHPDKGISFILGGIYFHRDATLYQYDPINPYASHSGIYSTEQFDTYGVNKST